MSIWSLADHGLARLLVFGLGLVPAAGCVPILSSLAVRSPEPIPPVPMASLVAGDSLHWVPNSLREIRDRRGVLVERHTDGLIVRLPRRDSTVLLSGAALGTLQVARGQAKSRERAFWRPMIFSVLGGLAGIGAEILVYSTTGRSLGGDWRAGPFVGLVGGTVVGLRQGHQPQTRWVPVSP